MGWGEGGLEGGWISTVLPRYLLIFKVAIESRRFLWSIL